MATDANYAVRMLALVARYGVRDQIDWWSGVPDDNVTFVVVIDELFEAGIHDHVPVAPSDVDSFEQALRDVGEASEGDYTFGPALYACRLRGMRPRPSAYPTDRRLHAIFDAAGRERPGLADALPAPAVAPVPVDESGWPLLPESKGAGS